MVEHQFDVTIIDIYWRKHHANILVDTFVSKYLVEAFHALAGNKTALLLGALTVALFHKCFAHGDNKDGCGIELSLVDVFLQEIKFFP